MSSEKPKNWDEVKVLWVEFNYYLIEANSQISPRERKLFATFAAVATLGLIGLAALAILKRHTKR